MKMKHVKKKKVTKQAYEDVSVLEIVSPVRSNFTSAANVPDVQFKALALDAFYIKSLRRSDLGKINLSTTYLFLRNF